MTGNDFILSLYKIYHNNNNLHLEEFDQAVVDWLSKKCKELALAGKPNYTFTTLGETIYYPIGMQNHEAYEYYTNHKLECNRMKARTCVKVAELDPSDLIKSINRCHDANEIADLINNNCENTWIDYDLAKQNIVVPKIVWY